jgi:hypothetical protein
VREMRGVALPSSAWRRAARTDSQTARMTKPPGTTTAKLHITQVSNRLLLTTGETVQVLNQTRVPDPGHRKPPGASRGEPPPVLRRTLSRPFASRGGAEPPGA